MNIMKKILSLSLLISSLFLVSSCSKNDEPDVPSQTAVVRYEATVDDPENFKIKVNYSKGEYNAGEMPSGNPTVPPFDENNEGAYESPFVSEPFQVKSGALLWLSATAEAKNENLIIDSQKATVEVRLYINDKLVKKESSKEGENYTLISCLYYPSGIIDFTPKTK